jgi:hypothetical protein
VYVCVVTWTVTRRVRKALLATKGFDGISQGGNGILRMKKENMYGGIDRLMDEQSCRWVVIK